MTRVHYDSPASLPLRPMHLSVAHDFLPKQMTVRASEVMDHFGIGFEQGRHVVAEGLELPLQSGQVVLFTGASGSGKSSLMRAAVEQLRRPCSLTRSAEAGSSADPRNQDRGSPVVLSLDDLVLPGSLLIDSLGLPTGDAMGLLANCGLAEAHLMLRTPAELSDGQRYRFRLALALAQQPDWIVADEFTATLDRILAKVIAFNLRRLCDRVGVGFLLATTHEDVIEDLDPDLHVRCRLDGDKSVQSHVTSAARANDTTLTDNALQPSVSCSPRNGSTRKKKERFPSPTSSGSPRRPDPTGRTSLGGITAAIPSASPAASSCSGTELSRSGFACSSPPRSLSDSAIITSGGVAAGIETACGLSTGQSPCCSES